MHIRLGVLDKEHQSLLKKIKRKRTELTKFVEQMRSLATEVFHRITPNFQRISDLNTEIHNLFEEIFANKKLSKKNKKNVRAIYLKLQSIGVISPKIHREQDEPELEEPFDNSDGSSSENGGGGYRNPQTDSEWDSPSANRTDDSRKVRQLFLKLAEIFHPDKVKDSETQIYHTEIMKEINKAYQEGDLARLLEIERQHQLGEYIDHNSEDDLSRKCKNLEQQNEILKNQYDNLKRELRQVKNTPEGSMVADSRKAAKQGVDAVEEMLETMEAQINIISEIRDFVKDFKENKMSIDEFVIGPRALRALDREMMEELLEEMMDELGVIRVY